MCKLVLFYFRQVLYGLFQQTDFFVSGNGGFVTFAGMFDPGNERTGSACLNVTPAIRRMSQITPFSFITGLR